MLPPARSVSHSRASLTRDCYGEAALVAERLLNESIVTTNWNRSVQSGTVRQGVREFSWSLRSDAWNQDPNWKQHPEKYSKYSYAEFDQDWGPSGEWGIIKSYSIDCSYSSGSGVIVQAAVNGRTKRAYVWSMASNPPASRPHVLFTRLAHRSGRVASPVVPL